MWEDAGQSDCKSPSPLLCWLHMSQLFWSDALRISSWTWGSRSRRRIRSFMEKGFMRTPVRHISVLLSILWKSDCYRHFHTHKYGETRIRTKFKFVSKTEIKSRPGKQATQDSLWKTKRANSCWSEIRDPEARISSRVWQTKYPGMNWNYWFSASGNYHTITGCEQSRRDQLLFQEEISEQHLDLRETCIRNMRDM